MSVRTCIIGGGATGSREHVFPAALGGRRTNKGIYCGKHNGCYSGLAGIISEQLAFFNAQLGVVGDHADESTSVTMTDVASGNEIEMKNGQVRFKGPQVRFAETVDGQIDTEMAFGSQKEAEDWVRQQQAKGVEIKVISKTKKENYYVGTAHKQVKLGGDQEGLRAIGYIAQTFLAHALPDIARLPALQVFKDYTLKNVGTGFVWWDFEPPATLPPNKFEFGHRVIVGLNSEDGTVYARVSFFSTLNFAILLATIPLETSRAIITDIDPLAKSPPNDIVTWTEEVAVGAVYKPAALSAGLAEAIGTGRAEAKISELMRRISVFERRSAAANIMRQIGEAAALSDDDRDVLFGGIVSGEGQRVFNLMRCVAKDLKHRASGSVEIAMAIFMEQAVELDPATENGLSEEASRSLALACKALARKMSEDCKAGVLDQDRMEMLIGGGLGAAVVGAALADKFVLRYPDL